MDDDTQDPIPTKQDTEEEPTSPKEAPITDTPEQEKPAKKSKKKIIIIALVIVLLGAGSAFAYYKFGKKSPATQTPTEEVTEQQEQQKKVETQKVWLVNYYDGVKEKFVEVSYDGTIVTPVKTSYTPSPSNEYIAKVTKKGVEVAKATEPDNTTVVLKKGAGQSTDFAWFNDTDELIVYTTKIVNKPKNPNTYYIPDVRQTFYSAKPDSAEKTRLFEHQELYGSAFILGASLDRDEFYWATAGEGGPGALFNISSLSTGKVVKKLTPKANTSDDIVIRGDDIYYTATTDTIHAINLDDYKDSLVLSPLGKNAGLTDTLLTSKCYLGGKIPSIASDGASSQSILFSTATNKPHQSTIQSMNTSELKAEKLLTLSSVRQIKILASDNDNVLFARDDIAICNNKKELSKTTNLYLLNRSTGKIKEVELKVNDLSFGGSKPAYLFEKPID